MNKYQAKGIAKEVAGKTQEQAGKFFGSKVQQVKGIEKQTRGKLEKAVGNAKEVIRGRKPL